MRSYKIFIGFSVLLLIIYIIAQINKPKPVNWTVTLSKSDKNPYGAYVLYDQLKHIFPKANINSYREPFYSRLHDNSYKNAVYFVLSPNISTDTLDVAEAYRFVENGNFIFISAYDLSKTLADTLGIKLHRTFDLDGKDSTGINFTNTSLHAAKNYTSTKALVNEYFDTIKHRNSTIVLGVNSKGKTNFIRVNCGGGAFFIHAAPLCFSNYFMLHNGNEVYTAKALSYIPAAVETIIWDEYYKLGRSGPTSPLRFFLSNQYLSWALWLSVVGLLLYVLFNIKRQQRIIPIITPLQNATLDFVKTIAGVYFSQKDNKAIAQKKLQYWLEFVRQRFYLSTQYLNNDFVQLLAKKSGVGVGTIEAIIYYASLVESSKISDKLLLEINTNIDNFYTQVT